MAINSNKFFYPPRPGNGTGAFDNIVGFQVVDGGGLTSAVFDFTTSVTEKVNRTFSIGTFSEPINLEGLDINDLNESRRIQATQFRVYPNYDVSQVLNFSLYGSLAKRFSVSIQKIINFFPASLDVYYLMTDFTTGATATNIVYDSVEDETIFKIPVERINNPFIIDFSVSATTNLAAREIIASEYRDMTKSYLNYALTFSGIDYQVIGFTPAQSLSSGQIQLIVSGQPFGTATTIYDDYLVKLNDYITDKVFLENFDEIEKFLLNRQIQPPYTANFQVPRQNDAGQFYTAYDTVTWPKDGPWNLDIRSASFDTYLAKLADMAEYLDSFKTNLISRFLVTDSIKEFDTMDHKVEKVLQLYGRSFDQIKQFIDALAFMNNVNYVPQNDIPSQLLVNLSKTLGWSNNFSPITNENFLDSVFGNTGISEYPGYAASLTPTELNYQFYRNLILNSAYLFKSKGTRRSVEFLLRLIGAPDALIDYNEHVYLADQRIDMAKFNTQFAQLSGGTYVNTVPSLDSANTYKLKGVLYSAYTTNTQYDDVTILRDDYPVDIFGWPKAPTPGLGTNSTFFQEGAGWYEQTPQHRSPNELQLNGLTFTGDNTNIQTQLQPFTYGGIYLQRFEQFPYMKEGFKIVKVVDNKKSWLDDDNKLRVSVEGGFNSYYYTDNDKLVLNVKNVDIFLNVGQGFTYDVWDQSNKYDYPIPSSGFTADFIFPYGVDDTFIDPQPQSKTFFEFAQTFWQNMINTRNRMYSSDGKTGGYLTLQSIFWKYLQSEQTVGLPNNKYTYQKLIEYVNSLGPYWMKLIENMIPATTIWNSGTRLENSIFHRQKYVYRRQRGCQIIPVPAEPCFITTNIFDYDCNTEYVDFFIYPWLNGDTNVSSFTSILNNRVDNFLTESGLTLTQCIQNSINSQWYLELKIGGQVIINQYFYQGYGINDAPTNFMWRTTLIDNLYKLFQYGFTYTINGNKLTITNLSCATQNLQDSVELNVCINLSINCN